MISPRGLVRSWQNAVVAAVLGWCGASLAAETLPVLYVGEGGWAIVAGRPEDVPPSEEWRLEQGLWIGRLPEDATSLQWGDIALDVSEGTRPPLAPAILPRVSNPFGPCVVRSLSLRFESQIRAHRWSLIFPRDGEEPEFAPLVLSAGAPVPLWLSVEDVDSRRVWRLQPERMGREGGMFERQRGEARLYAGFFDDKQVEWHLVVARTPEGRRVVQGRLRTFSGPPRRFRVRLGLQTGAPGQPVVQEISPPAVVTMQDDVAVAMFVDLAEPRRYRALADEPDGIGMAFDLAVTRATGNFPRSATFSVEVDAWETAPDADLESETIQQMVRLTTAAPLEDVHFPATLIEPSRLVLAHPGGFQDEADVLQYLMLRMSGLFEDYEWVASGFLGNALNARGRAVMDFDGDRVIMAVNADPDLETVLEWGQNRGVTVLQHILREAPAAVWIRAAGDPPRLDHSIRALFLCDYPAIWPDGSTSVGVDVGHAEAELIAALACVLRNRDIRLLISDSGALAPFTTAYADGLVCESDDIGEMRRQHALAAGRPVFWRVENPCEDARALAQEWDWDLRMMK